jgi:hypothetical protein
MFQIFVLTFAFLYVHRTALADKPTQKRLRWNFEVLVLLAFVAYVIDKAAL